MGPYGALPRPMQDAVRPPQVDGEFGQLFGSLDVLEKATGELQNRLGSVLREVAPEVAQNAKMPLEVLVPMAQRVREITDRVRRISSIVSQTTARLEL